MAAAMTTGASSSYLTSGSGATTSATALTG